VSISHDWQFRLTPSIHVIRESQTCVYARWHALAACSVGRVMLLCVVCMRRRAARVTTSWCCYWRALLGPPAAVVTWLADPDWFCELSKQAAVGTCLVTEWESGWMKDSTQLRSGFQRRHSSMTDRLLLRQCWNS